MWTFQILMTMKKVSIEGNMAYVWFCNTSIKKYITYVALFLQNYFTGVNIKL